MNKNFDKNEVLDILESIEPQVINYTNKLQKHSITPDKAKKSLYQSYQESTIIEFAKTIKKIPLVGTTLLWFKHKVLQWH